MSSRGLETTGTGPPGGRTLDVPRPNPLVVAIIVNWNNLSDTLECVQSLRESDYSNLAVWVVDNDSREDPTAVLQRQDALVRVIRTARNLGYGGGINCGIREAIKAGAGYVLLLNNDVVVARDMVRRLVMSAAVNGHIAMATPVVFYYDRPTEVYWDGGFVDWRTGNTPHESRGRAVEHGLIESEWLDGCVLMARVAAIHEVGLLDERYFLYFEDTEWSVRTSRRGWTNVVVKEAKAWHKVSRSTGGTANPAVRFYYLRNRYLFLRAHHPARNGLAWRLRYVRRIWREYIGLRHERAGREAVIAASLSLLGERWGPYETPPGRRWLIRALDAGLAPLRGCVDPAKRARSWLRTRGGRS